MAWRWLVWNLSYSISATFPLQESRKLIKLSRKWVSKKDHVSSVSVKSLEHVLNPESYHPSHFRIHPVLWRLHLMIPAVTFMSYVFFFGIILKRKKKKKERFRFPSNMFPLSWPVLQNCLKLYGFEQSKWPLCHSEPQKHYLLVLKRAFRESRQKLRLDSSPARTVL